MRYYDISVPLFDGMVAWPSDPPVRVRTHQSVKRGDPSNVEKLEFSSHAGTHLDAPNHIGLDRTVDEIPPRTLVGPAIVVTSRAKREVSAHDVDGLNLKNVRRILFKTRNSSRPDDGRFHDDFVALSPELAGLLAKARVKLVGLDAMSVDAKGGKGEVHRTLLGAGVVLLENINLSTVSAGEYELLCLPLRLAGGDGAPARAILRSVPDTERCYKR